MSRILGLDLGSNSIGWALIDDEEKRIIGAGVRAFKEGVNLEHGREESKNAARRGARLARRQCKRRASRRRRLISILKPLAMYPDNYDDISSYYQMDPYELRRKGLYDKLTLLEFGRILLHICKRRGFKSNRKGDPSENNKIYKGIPKEGIAGITETKDEMGTNPLGEYLAGLDPHRIRRRNRFTSRAMYEEEFERLWEKQKNYHLDNLNKSVEKSYVETVFKHLRIDKDKIETVKEVVKTAIFHQRKLKSMKWAVNMCELEPKKKVAPVSSPLFQYYRILEQVNRIRITIHGTPRYDDPLTKTERKILIDKLNTKKEMEFTVARKLLKLPPDARINLEKSEKLIGNKTNAQLMKVFGEKRWNKMSADEQYGIWHTFHFSDDLDWLKEHAAQKWNLTGEELEEIKGVRLEDEYGRYSAKALKKLIPHLEKGLSVTEAIPAAGYSTKQMETEVIERYLPPPENLRNPIVQQALHELRHVVNAIIREYGQPDIARVELARELRKSKNAREKMWKEQRERFKKNEDIKKRLKEEYNVPNPTMEDVLKYKLWEECGQKSPYSGKTISREALFSGAVHIDHIIPYSRSLDDSSFNKTLCFSDENAEKGDQTPYEAYSSNPQEYDEILQRARATGLNDKLELFLKKELDDDFIDRQLNDTAYFSKEAKKYLSAAIPNVQAVKGGTTAVLRGYWGLNGILGEGNIKTRDDHRHHAVDALVVANTSVTFVKRISDYNKFEFKLRQRPHEGFPPPWDNFRNDAEAAVKSVLVSHRVNRKVTGQLHEATYYGEITDRNGKSRYVVRKNIKALTPAQIADIVDTKVREIVFLRVEQFGMDTTLKIKNTKPNIEILKKAFAEPLIMPDGRQIKSVRLYVEASNMIQLYKNQKKNKHPYKLYVEPGGNHHIAIFENEQGKRKGVVVSLFEAVQRVRNGEPVIQRADEPGWKFIMSLSIDELVLIDINKESINLMDNEKMFIKLYRVQKMRADDNRIYFRRHNAATIDNPKDEYVKSPSGLNAVKVIIDSIGKLKLAE